MSVIPQDNNSRLSRQDCLLVLGLFAAAFLARYYFLPFYRVISADGVGYVTAARNLLAGDFSTMTVYGVVYPSLTALVSLATGSTEIAGRLVSVFMGALLVLPLYCLGRDFFNRNVGIIACILVVAWPTLRSWAGEVMTQATYITLLVTWYWLLWQAYRRNSWRWALMAGCVAGLSYLTRPEALIAFVCMVLIFFFPGSQARPPARRFFLATISALSFIALLLPFVVLVHQVTGEWQLTGKGGVTLADALSEYLGRPDLKHEPGFKTIGIFDVIRRYPDFLWPNFRKNLLEGVMISMPWYLWFSGLVGLICGGWQREQIARRLFLMASCAPLVFIMIFFFAGPEYVQPYLPVLFLWVGSGMQQIERRFWNIVAANKPHVLNSVKIAPVSIAIASAMTMFSLYSQIPADRNKPYHYSDDGGRYDQRRIGELLKKYLPPQSRIMTRWGRISFYAEMQNVSMPQTGLSEMLASARKSGARYLVIDGMLMNARPQFQLLFAPLLTSAESVLYQPGASEVRFEPLPGVRLILLFKDPSSLGVAVYEII